MTAAVSSAMRMALALMRAPSGVNAARGARFPEDVTALLRVVAADTASVERMVQLTGESSAVVCDAAEFFVQQVCFMPGVDSYRVLAANRDDQLTRIREHYRLLVRWLHPDRNSDAWQTVFLDRVNRAWRDLRGPKERELYESIMPPEHEFVDEPLLAAGLPRTAIGLTNDGRIGKRVSARTMRRLPAMVLAGLGVFASLVLAVMYIGYDEGVDDQAVTAMGGTSSAAAEVIEMSPRFVRSEARDEPETPVPNVDTAPRIALPAPEFQSTDSPLAAVDSPQSPTEAGPAATPVIAAPSTPASNPLADPQRVPAALMAATGTASRRRKAQTADSQADDAVGPAPASGQGLAVAVAQIEADKATVPEALDRGDDAGPETSLASTAAVAARADSRSIDQRVVDDLLQQFGRAYDQGDLIGMMALFTREARNIPKDSRLLADDYRELFETSKARQISLHDMSWWQEGEMVAVVASFDAAITPNGKARPRRLGGNIRFELRHEDGAVRIARIRHQVQ
jgi:hypothetical protein